MLFQEIGLIIPVTLHSHNEGNLFSQNFMMTDEFNVYKCLKNDTTSGGAVGTHPL